ncbi:DUF4381 domain-containing protein [Dyella humicola]|uniref:DUF4381 domain-containing protein n=1 Tax=Dyella humicola TaxID=2992126 RepID=UPI002255A143|nr:DUF4381 domain-containing protein [Dyella humicola]
MMAMSGHAPVDAGPVLRDIHLPRDPSWWPPAPGWWMLALLLVALGSISVWWWFRRNRRRAIEHAVLAEVDLLAAQWSDQPQQLAAGLHQLLRRGALRYDAEAARVHGQDWRRILAVVSDDQAILDPLTLLESAMYRPDPSFDKEATVAATQKWLRMAWRHPPIRKASSATQRSSQVESSHA